MKGSVLSSTLRTITFTYIEKIVKRHPPKVVAHDVDSVFQITKKEGLNWIERRGGKWMNMDPLCLFEKTSTEDWVCLDIYGSLSLVGSDETYLYTKSGGPGDRPMELEVLKSVTEPDLEETSPRKDPNTSVRGPKNTEDCEPTGQWTLSRTNN